MFETSVVRTQAAASPKRVGLLTMSIALHSAAIVAAVAVSVASTNFPAAAPDQMELLRIAQPVSLPPALGRPDGGGKPASPKPTVAPKPIAPTQPVAPTTVPDAVPTADSASVATDVPAAGGDGSGTSSEPLGREDGVPGGVGTGDGTGIGTVEPPANVIHKVGGGVLPPRVLSRVEPAYPQIMISTRMQAVVMVQFVIDRSGRVSNATIVRSSYPPFNNAVLEAVQKWTFAPGTLNGQPVDTYFDLTVRFQVR